MTTYIASDNTDLQTLINEAARTASEEHRAEIIFPPGTVDGAVDSVQPYDADHGRRATIRFIADPQLYPPVWTRWEGLNAMRCTRFCTPRMPATLPFAGRGD